MYKGFEKNFRQAKTGLFSDLWFLKVKVPTNCITTKETCTLFQFVFGLKFFKPGPSYLKAGKRYPPVKSLPSCISVNKTNHAF